MRLNKKFYLIGSILLMVSLIASLYVRIRFGAAPKINLDVDIHSSLYIGFIILFLWFAYYFIRRSTPIEKKVWFGWVICFLLQQVIFLYPGISTPGNVVSVIAIGFSIYYSVQLLEETS